jgi:NAD+ synthase (glutamine-hydrolysing)
MSSKFLNSILILISKIKIKIAKLILFMTVSCQGKQLSVHMKICIEQLDYTIGDLKGNTSKIINAIGNARQKESELVLFSELAICGYPPEDLLLHPCFLEEMRHCLDEIVLASKDIAVIVGLARCNTQHIEKPIFNSAAIIENKKLLGFQDKCLLPTYDVFSERRYFEPGKKVQVWKLAGKKVAVLICEDIWQHAGEVGYTIYANDPVKELKPLKPDVLVNLSASPYHYEKPDVRIKVCQASAITLKCPVAMCCQVGGNDQLIFDGYSVFVNGNGKLSRFAKGFEEDEMFVDTENTLTSIAFEYDAMKDLYSALVLGMRDYFHKCGFKKACLGLSGGIDSALAACIAAEALGPKNVLGVSMPSRYSSEGSIADAQTIAKHLGIEYQEISIEGPFETYLNTLQPIFAGKKPDVTEENLQARIRGMLLMAISNKLSYIVVCPSNKSELALGYSTLYGDMCGGLAIIGDVPKTQIYALARWINRNKEIIPNSTINKPPSAELKPNQKDSDTLPAYEIVDAVLRDYVEEFMEPEKIANKNKLPLEIVNDLIHRIHQAEYKRRQAPPVLRVTKKAFGAGRKYPIVQRWK